MIILNYILSLSIVLLSVVKTADLFSKSDKALLKIEEQFIEKTRSLHQTHLKNEKGSISLTAAILTIILSLVLLFYVTKMKIEYREAVYRKESYLCFFFLNRQTQLYINEMTKFNWSLSAAFIAQGSVVATSEAIEVFKLLVMARNIRHFYYLKKLATNKYCQLPETFSFLKNTPFKTQANLALITNIDETSIMRQKKWSYLYYKNPIGIRIKKSFCLKSTFQMENIYYPKTKYTSAEVPMVDLPSLKCFSGLSLSPPS